MKLILCSLIVLILVSCTNSAPQASTIPLTAESPIVTSSATATKLSPSKTPSPTKLPTNTPVVLQSNYVFPAWMGDPDTNILAALITNDLEHTRKVSFFNATTGENYEIEMPRDVSGYFWYDNENFGLLSKDLQTAYRINLQTGKIFTEAVSSQSTKFLDREDDYENSYGDTANALELTKDINTDGIIFRRIWYGKYGTRSSNGRFSADWNGESNTAIAVTDNETNKIIWESQTAPKTYGTILKWSPKDESHLAYIQGKIGYPLGEYITESTTLTIVDVVTGKVLGSYAGDFGRIEWSTDGKKILYEDPMSHYGSAFRDAPCILFLNLGENRCLRSIPRLVPEGYNLTTTGRYEWGPDNQTIFYIYIYGKEGNVIGNLCMYSLLTSYITCPTDNLQALNGMTVISHDVSPDQQFVHFCYSASSILNDYADTSYDGVIRLDGTGFFSWIGAIQVDGPQICSSGILWRPPR